jgi:hypothetical protein
LLVAVVALVGRQAMEQAVLVVVVRPGVLQALLILVVGAAETISLGSGVLADPV